MNEPEIYPPTFTGDNSEKVDSLRSQMNLLFGCLLVASFTLTAFLGLQARRSSLDLIALKGPAEESLRLVQQDDSGVEATFGKLTEFGRTHPDFQKVVLSNFHLSTNSAAVKK